MANQNSAKGNPASKRMTNPKRKAKRERSWKKRQEVKAKNIAANERRRKANDDLRKVGQLTPYQERRLAQRDEYELTKAAKKLAEAKKS